MKEIALIIPNNIWVSPYLSIYTRIFDKLGASYDIISWDREDRQEIGIQFKYKEKSRNQLFIFLSYIKFSHFLKRTIKKNGYKKVVVFTPQVGLFISSFLEKYYRGQYIFDYRDLSIEQKPFFAKRLKKILLNSYANVISSPGFKKYLPSGYNYLISHNFNVDIVRNSLENKITPYLGDEIKVLTIGALRTDMNIEVMDALGNEAGFHLYFVGKGISAAYLENYAKSKKFDNVVFTGFYKKDEEPEIYENNTFVNIVYPLIPSHISALSNRFYNSLIYKRPMIVTKGTVQGDYAQQYEVGLVIENCDSLDDKIRDYRMGFDYQKYSKQCNELLKVFLKENDAFETIVKQFVENNV